MTTVIETTLFWGDRERASYGRSAIPLDFASPILVGTNPMAGPGGMSLEIAKPYKISISRTGEFDKDNTSRTCIKFVVPIPVHKQHGS